MVNYVITSSKFTSIDKERRLSKERLPNLTRRAPDKNARIFTINTVTHDYLQYYIQLTLLLKITILAKINSKQNTKYP